MSLSARPTTRQRLLSGHSFPSQVLCKAGPTTEGHPPSAGVGDISLGPKICDRDEGARPQGAGLCWPLGWVPAAKAPRSGTLLDMGG